MRSAVCECSSLPFIRPLPSPEEQTPAVDQSAAFTSWVTRVFDACDSFRTRTFEPSQSATGKVFVSSSSDEAPTSWLWQDGSLDDTPTARWNGEPNQM